MKNQQQTKRSHLCTLFRPQTLSYKTIVGVITKNMTGPKTLPTIWDTYMTLVTKYQISAIRLGTTENLKEIH
jgi:hypothetical protein